jgi:transcriptional regulator with XRE-family HTH domain
VANRGRYADNTLPPGALRDLTQAIRDCCNFLSDRGVSLRDIAKDCNVSKSTVSALINGRVQRPSQGFLKSLHKLTEKHAGDGASSAPSIEKLSHLLEAALGAASNPRACRSCGRPWDNTSPNPLVPPLPRAAEPGSAEAEPAARPVLPTIGNATLPVPSEKGDRQGEWKDMADLKARIKAGEIHDAAGILRHIGQDGDGAEAAAAVAACHREGLTDAAATIVAYAAHRDDEDIFIMMKVLLDDGEIGSAARLAALRLERK